MVTLLSSDHSEYYCNSRGTSQRLLTSHRGLSSFQIFEEVGMPNLCKPICSSSILVRLTRREHVVCTLINSVLVPESGKRLHNIDSET